jgi:uncharacterized repeat protein (TIGR03803 family)
MLSSITYAQTETVVYDFQGSPDGAAPGTLIQGTDGNFYGMTASGGNVVADYCPAGCGTVFELSPVPGGGCLGGSYTGNGWCETVLYSFCSQASCSDGYNPDALIQGNDGNFYGTTFDGGTGAQNSGTVFKITPQGSLTVLYNFCSQTNCIDGRFPLNLIKGTNGNFYGVTEQGGGGVSTSGPGCFAAVGECGTVFEITPPGSLTTLYSFCSQTNCSDGIYPTDLIQGNDGNFYGTTRGGAGGTSGGAGGTVFEITPDGSLTTLYNFCSKKDCADGYSPFGLIQAKNGNFYGITQGSGDPQEKTVCPSEPSSGTPSCPSVFALAGGNLSTLYKFVETDVYVASLIQANDSNFYGLTSPYVAEACSGPCGSVFKVTPSRKLTTLYNFCSQSGCTDGYGPQVLVQAANGDFFGGTFFGGTYNHGTVFSLPGPHPVVTLSPESLNFGKEALNKTSAPKKVTLKNTGTAPVTISDILASANFAISNTTTCGTLPISQNKTCDVYITFTPSELGPLTGTLSVFDDADNSPQTVSLEGTGD